MFAWGVTAVNSLLRQNERTVPGATGCLSVKRQVAEEGNDSFAPLTAGVGV